MLLAATAARAFDFRVELSAGQKVYFTIIAGTQTVKVVNPDWDSYTPPSGALTLPSSVQNNGTTYNVVDIDDRAFQNCTALTAVTVPEGVTRIGRLAFMGCTQLESITLPSTLTVVGSYAFTSTAYFSNNENITDEGLLFIGSYLIASLPSLATGTITLPNGTLGVGNMAFYTCSSLERAVLPATVRFIGEQAFNGCTSLDTLEMLNEVPPTLESNAFTDVESFAVLVPCHSVDTYRESENWSTLNLVEKHCNTDIHEQIEEPTPWAVATAGGVLINVPSGNRSFTVCDIMGRSVAQSMGGFVALPSHGVYVIASPGMKPLKVLF